MCHHRPVSFSFSCVNVCHMCKDQCKRASHPLSYPLCWSWSYNPWRLWATGNFSPLEEQILLLSHLSPVPHIKPGLYEYVVCVHMYKPEAGCTSSISFHIELGWSSPNLARVAGPQVQRSLLRHPNVKPTDVQPSFKTLCSELMPGILTPEEGVRSGTRFAVFLAPRHLFKLLRFLKSF